jgi:hypothetical protein
MHPTSYSVDTKVLVVRWQEHDNIDHSFSSSAKVDTEWSNTTIPLCVFVAYTPPSFTYPKTQLDVPQNLNPQ